MEDPIVEEVHQTRQRILAECDGGAYRILRRLGRGGMGEVFLAYDERLKRSVAIKRIRQGQRAGLRQRLRFRREAQLAARLNHPAVVRVYDILEGQSGDFLVMEYVPGVTLAQKLQSGPLSPARVVPLALQIVAGLEEAHAKGLVHRDLKAENVIVAPDGQAKILDFGLAKLADAEGADPDLTLEGELLGTPRAMSPEQAGGGPVDHRSDLFSLGVLLYEMASGCSPFQGESLSETLRNILTFDPPPVSSLSGQAWPELDRLIAALLAKDPKQRPQSARDVKAALGKIAGRPERQAQPHAEGLLAEGALSTARTGSFQAEPVPPGLTEPLLELGLARPKRALARLPVPATAFVGRQADLTEIEERLADPSCRLLTLVGPGGTGKTRLALEAARRQRDSFEGQVHFIPLAASRPELLEATLAEGLQVTLDPQGDPEVQLADLLAEARMILVLDNFEHLTERAGLVASLVAAAPEVKILVTSREGLNLQCEWLQEVGGLDLPPQGNPERLEEFSAVQLFQQAARRARKDFSLRGENRREVVEICRLVNGLPLGIELAANWLRVLSCSEICQEIRTNLDLLSTAARDLPQRHRSLRAVFSSSVALLGEQERDVFRRLSVFRGGFDRQAAQTVAGASLAVLLDLVNKSMLSQVASSR
ncbi:MAG: protein kinase [Acidobacteriota bacterium]